MATNGQPRSRRRPRGGLLLKSSALAFTALGLKPCHGFLLAPRYQRFPVMQKQAVTMRTASDSSPTPAEWYLSLWGDALAKLEERLPSLELYPLPSDLRHHEGKMPGKDPSKQAAIVSQGYAYRLPGTLRQVRTLVLTTKDALSPQVINFVIFPEPSSDLPILGADLVTLPGGDLIALDLQPVRKATDDYLERYYRSRLKGLHERYQGLLPAGGGEIPEAAAAFFSPYHLFARLPHDAPDLAEQRETCRQAFMDYLDAYLDLVTGKRLGEGGEGVRQAHLAYSRYRFEKDPARGMLKRLFGEEYTERLLSEFLFDLVSQEGGQE